MYNVYYICITEGGGGRNRKQSMAKGRGISTRRLNDI